MNQELILKATRKEPCNSDFDKVANFCEDDFKDLTSNCD